jgi:hypothetical protein
MMHLSTDLSRISNKKMEKFGHWTRESLRTSSPKEGTAEAIEKSSLQNGSRHGRTSLADTSRRNGW